MADYHEQQVRPAGGVFATPILGVRNDPGGDLAAANQQLGALQLSSDGGAKVNSEGMKATFSCVITGLGPAASCTDLVTLSGSATKTVKLTRLEVVGVATAAVGVDAQLVKRSTADTGGTSTTPTPTPYDANDTATAVVNAYTANPAALGTIVGSAIRATKLQVNTPAATPDPVAWEFGTRPGTKQPTLRGVAQQLALNLSGQTVGAGGSFDVLVEWTEEPTTA